MRIIYKGCVYNCTDKTTIQNMLNNGGVIFIPPSIEPVKEIAKEDNIKTVKTRGKKKKWWGDTMREMFLTYTEYQELGGKLDDVSFDRLEYRAEKIIKAKINRDIDIDEDVKRCTFEIIDCINEIVSNSNSAGSVRGIKNDGYSISYSVNKENNITDIYGINGIINSYLHKYMKPRGISYV